MWQKLRKYFLAGLVVLVPLASTLYLLVGIINFADGLLGRFIAPVFYEQFGFYVRGLSILIGIAFVVLVGFSFTHFIGEKAHAFFENVLLRLPFFRQVYPAFKEISLFLFSRNKLAFQQVVLVQFPRPGVYSCGFLRVCPT